MCYKTRTRRLTGGWIDEAWREAAYAVRSLAKSRGFTAAAVLTLATHVDPLEALRVE